MKGQQAWKRIAVATQKRVARNGPCCQCYRRRAKSALREHQR